jgi:hypothetical protein
MLRQQPGDDAALNGVEYGKEHWQYTCTDLASCHYLTLEFSSHLCLLSLRLATLSFVLLKAEKVQADNALDVPLSSSPQTSQYNCIEV